MSRRTSSIKLLRDASKERQEYEQQKKALKEQMNRSRQNLTELRRKRHEPLAAAAAATAVSEGNNSSSGSITSAASAQRLSVVNAGERSNGMTAAAAGGSRSRASSSAREPVGSAAEREKSAVPQVNAEVIAALQAFSAKDFVAGLAPEPPNVYDRMRPLGAGAFGTVMLVKDQTTNKLYAMKNIVTPEPGSEDVVLQEVHILRTLKHPCIVELQAVFVSQDVKLLSIVLTYCESGDLAKVICNAQKTNTPVPEAQIIRWFVQVCLAVQCCHEHHIIHRDLKPSNVLLTDNRSMVKLADFGLAKVVKSEAATVMSEVGTPYYSALEMISNQPYSYPVDVWSLGIMLYEMMQLEVPYPGHDAAEIVRALMKNEPRPLPEHYHPDLRSLVWSMLQRDPEVRPKVEQVICSTTLFRTADNFVSNYKPMHLEERSRRAHVRQLNEQLQRIRHTAKAHRTRSSLMIERPGPATRSLSYQTVSDEGMDRIDSTSSMEGSTKGGGTDTDTGDSRCNSANVPRRLRQSDRMDSIEDEFEPPEHVQLVDTDGNMDALVLPNLPRTPSPVRQNTQHSEDATTSETALDHSGDGENTQQTEPAKSPTEHEQLADETPQMNVQTENSQQNVEKTAVTEDEVQQAAGEVQDEQLQAEQNVELSSPTAESSTQPANEAIEPQQQSQQSSAMHASDTNSAHTPELELRKADTSTATTTSPRKKSPRPPALDICVAEDEVGHGHSHTQLPAISTPSAASARSHSPRLVAAGSSDGEHERQLPPPTPTGKSGSKTPRWDSAQQVEIQGALNSIDGEIVGECTTHSPISLSDTKTLALPLVQPSRHHPQHDEAVEALTAPSARSSARKSSMHQLELVSQSMPLPLLNTQSLLQDRASGGKSPRAGDSGVRSARQTRPSSADVPSSDCSKRPVLSAR